MNIFSILKVNNRQIYVISGLLILLVTLLSGCSRAPIAVVTPTAPLYYVPAETWKAVDEQIYSASASAEYESITYSLHAMNNWRQRVRQRTEEIFIPWYSSYWTQQGLATRIAWYKLQYAEGEATPEQRMASYLQEVFYEQVLEPVSTFIDPHAVMKMATAIYLRELNYRIQQLPDKYHIPVEQFDHHLKFIPAINVNAGSLQEASLYEVLQATELSALPAYKSLLTQINAIDDGADPLRSKNALDRVANRAVIKLVEQMEVRGSATIASLLVGGYAGMLISAGSVTWSITEHTGDKPDMKLQLQDSLDLMLNEMWQDLVKDKHTGVNAVVHHISNQIEYSLFTLDPAGSRLF